LADHPGDTAARVHQVSAAGQYRKSSPIEPGQNMVDLRPELAADCPEIAASKTMDLCGVIRGAPTLLSPRRRALA
jgi:hypothetical protein